MSKSIPKLLLIATYKPSEWSDRLSTFILPHNSDTKEVLLRKNEYTAHKVISNDPISGFKLLGMSSTVNTKWWRIQDPRGFEGTISSSCIGDILWGPGIAHGELQGMFVWTGQKILTFVG